MGGDGLGLTAGRHLTGSVVRRPQEEGPPGLVLGGGHDGRGRSQRADGAIQQGADDGRRGAGHGHLQLHEGPRRRRRQRQGRRQPFDRHAHGGEHAGAAPAVRRGRGRHLGRARVPGGGGQVPGQPENRRDRVARHARLQATPGVRGLLVVRRVPVPVPIPVIPVPLAPPVLFPSHQAPRSASLAVVVIALIGQSAQQHFPYST